MKFFFEHIPVAGRWRFAAGVLVTYVCFHVFGHTLGAMMGAMTMSFLFIQDFYDGINNFAKTLVTSMSEQLGQTLGWLKGDLRPVELFMDGCLNHKTGIALQLKAIYQANSKMELFERCGVLLSLFNLEQVAISVVLKSIVESTRNRFQSADVSPLILKRLGLLTVATDMVGITNFKSGSFLGAFAKNTRDGETVAKELVSILQDLGLVDDPNANLFKNLTEKLEYLNSELRWLKEISDINQASLNKEDNRKRYYELKDSIEELLAQLTAQKTNQYGNRCFQMLFSQVTLIKSQTKVLFGEIDCMLANMSNRPTPVGVCLVGKSRIGKSYYAEFLRLDVARRLKAMAATDPTLVSAFGRSDEFQTWCANTRDEYDEGYYGQEFHYIDDAFQQKDHKDHLPLINFISNNPVGTVQAKIDAKGRPYRTYAVFCSSNTVPIKSSTVETIDALHQRFPILIHCDGTDFPKVATDLEFKHLKMNLTTMALYAEGRQDGKTGSIVGIPVTPDHIAQVIAQRIVAEYKTYRAASEVYANLAAQMNVLQEDADLSKQMAVVKWVKETSKSEHHLLDKVFSGFIDPEGRSPFTNRSYSSWFDVLKHSSIFCTTDADFSRRVPGRCILIDPITTQKWLFGRNVNNGKQLVLLPEREFTLEDYNLIMVDSGKFDFSNCGFDMLDFVMPKLIESDFDECSVLQTSVYLNPRLVVSRSNFDLEETQTAFDRIRRMFSPLNTFYGKLIILVSPILGLDVWDSVSLFLREHKKLVSGVVVTTVLVAFATFVYKLCTTKNDYEMESSGPLTVSPRRKGRRPGIQTSGPLSVPGRKRQTRVAETSGPNQVRPVRKTGRAQTSAIDVKSRKKIRNVAQEIEVHLIPDDESIYDLDTLSIEAQRSGGELYSSFEGDIVDFSQYDISSKDIFLALKDVSDVLSGGPIHDIRIMGGCGTASPSQRKNLFVAEGEALANWSPKKNRELMVCDARFDYYPYQFCRRPTLAFSIVARGNVDHESEIMDLIEMIVPDHSSIGVCGFITGKGEFLLNFVVLSRESQDIDVDLLEDSVPSKDILSLFAKRAGVDIDISIFNLAQSSDDQSLQLCKTFYDKYSVIVWAAPGNTANKALRNGDFTGLKRIYHGIGCENYILTLNHGSGGVGTYQIFTRQNGKKSDGQLFSEQDAILFGVCTGVDEQRDTSVYRLLTREEIRISSGINFEKLVKLLDNNIQFGKALETHMMTEERLSHVFKTPQDVCFTCPTIGVVVMGRCERAVYDVYVGEKQRSLAGSETTDLFRSVSMVGAETWSHVVQAPTQSGDCGGAYFLMNSTIQTKFVGLHHAGNYTRNVAMSTVVSLDLFNSLKKSTRMFNANRLQALDPFRFDYDGSGALHVPPVTMAPDNDDLFSVFVDKTAEGSNVPSGDHVRSYGKYLLPHRPEGRGSTQYKHRSPFYGCFDIVRYPPPFYATDSRIKDPLPRNSKGEPSLTLRANNAMGMKAPPLNQEVLNDCVEKLSAWFSVQMADKSIGIYPQEDVIHLGMNGRSCNKFVRHMRVGKSAGAPHTALGCPRKSDYVELNTRGDYVFKNTKDGVRLRDSVYGKLDKSSRLVRTTSFIGCSLKDQPIANKHIEAGKVRVFYPVPIENFLIGRGLFGPFWEAMSSEPIKFRNSIGINELSMDWKNLYEQLKVKGNVIDLDFKEWDKHLPAELLIGAYMIAILAIEKASDDGFKNHRIVHMWEMVRSIIIDGDTAFITDHGNKSGSPDTTHINSLAGLLALFYIYSLEVGYVDLDEFLEMIYSSHNGDDIAISVDDRVKHLFNYKTLTKAFSDMGMIATPGMKGDFVEGQLFTTLHEMTFLKRQFVEFEDMVFCPIDEASVYSRFGYTRNTASDLDEIKGTINAAMDEWVMMGKQIYDENMNLLRDRAMSRGFDSSVRNAVAPLLAQDYEGHLGYVRFLFHANVPRFDLDLQKDRFVYKRPANLLQGGIAEEISATGGTLYDVLNAEGVPTLRSDLDRVQSDVMFLAQRTEALEGRVNVLNSRVIDLDVTIQGFSEELQAGLSQIDGLSSQVAALSAQFTALSLQVATFDSRIQSNTTSIGQLNSSVGALTTRVSNNEVAIRFRVPFNTYYQFRAFITGIETRTEIKSPDGQSEPITTDLSDPIQHHDE